MNDEQRSAKDEAGPQDLTRGKQFTEPTDDDTAAHGLRWGSPEPAAPGPEEQTRAKSFTEPTDDAETH